jgi:transcriptional pleiotropic regulator of transition state genes
MTRSGRSSSGIARKVDDLGRIVLPAEMRKALDIGDGDYLEIVLDDERIVLQKVEDRCTFCRSTNELRAFHGKQVCARCHRELAAGTG